jgi:hypothetical protein
MHLSKVNEALDHKIVGGSEHQWRCWPNARFLDYESDYAHASVVFSTETQEVYLAEVNDKNDSVKPYRWLNPIYKQAFVDESIQRGVSHIQAWDNTNWYDLETQEDWLDKASAIMHGEKFDTRIQVPIELDREEMFKLMNLAHDRDITLNQLVEEILWEVIKRNE